jgi:hypothetical protein
MTHSRPEPEIAWREYPRIAPGQYPAYAAFAKTYQDRAYRRWVCLVLFDVLADDLLRVIARVPLWLNLGSGEKPRAGRRGNYLREWVKANRGPPVRGDRLSPKVFVGRIARVEVGDTDAERSPIPYSVVRRIVRWETGGTPGHSVNHSHSQGQQGLAAADTESCSDGMATAEKGAGAKAGG